MFKGARRDAVRGTPGAVQPGRSGGPAGTTKQVGDQAEQQALLHLQRHGLVLVQRNYRLAGGPRQRGAEIDLVMRAPDGTLLKHKARFCVDGSRQKQRIDFHETFAPVVGWATVRINLILSVLCNLHCRQIDFVQAFPQANIDIPGLPPPTTRMVSHRRPRAQRLHPPAQEELVWDTTRCP